MLHTTRPFELHTTRPSELHTTRPSELQKIKIYRFSNSMADALTRTVLALIQELPKPIDFDAIADAQKIDPETKLLSNAIASLQLKLLPVNNSYKKILCDESQNELCVILPPSFRRKAFDMIHSLNHAGIKSTLHIFKQNIFWPNISKDVKNWVSECNNCQKLGQRMQQLPTCEGEKSHPNPRRSFPRTNPSFRGIEHRPNRAVTFFERIQIYLHYNRSLYQGKLCICCT